MFVLLSSWDIMISVGGSLWWGLLKPCNFSSFTIWSISLSFVSFDQFGTNWAILPASSVALRFPWSNFLSEPDLMWFKWQVNIPEQRFFPHYTPRVVEWALCGVSENRNLSPSFSGTKERICLKGLGLPLVGVLNATGELFRFSFQFGSLKVPQICNQKIYFTIPFPLDSSFSMQVAFPVAVFDILFKVFSNII